MPEAVLSGAVGKPQLVVGDLDEPLRALAGRVPPAQAGRHVEDLLSAMGKALRAELPKVAAALTEAQKLADRPRGRYTIAWNRDYVSTLVPHVNQARELVREYALQCKVSQDLAEVIGAVEDHMRAGEQLRAEEVHFADGGRGHEGDGLADPEVAVGVAGGHRGGDGAEEEINRAHLVGFPW